MLANRAYMVSKRHAAHWQLLYGADLAEGPQGGVSARLPAGAKQLSPSLTPRASAEWALTTLCN